MVELLWFLLPVAAASGWYAARRGSGRESRSTQQEGLRSDYFKGINYLLNEQPDKAIEVFIKVLEVDSETVETHLALGNLYRRRGEVDRAIRIHQNLIARPTLSQGLRNEALLELGQDYMSAGLLDRAENLFQELADTDSYTVNALRQVTDIYEQEKDWDKAIESSVKLEKATGSPLGRVIAHYYCEQAEARRLQADAPAAHLLAKKALDTDPSCVRASLITGDLLLEEERCEEAIEVLKRIETQDPAFVPEFIDRIETCYARLDDLDGLATYMTGLLERYGGITTALALTDLKQGNGGAEDAVAFLVAQLQDRPSVRGFDRLLSLQLEAAGHARPAHLCILKDLTTQLLKDRPVYRCEHCGFEAKALFWQCPSCKHWTTTKPIQGLEGE